jgi:hypothetical protein
MQREAFRAICAGGLVAGVLDITDAFVFFGLHGVAPIRILQSISSGILGANAYRGGWGTAILGLGLHFLIALGAATVYYLASRHLSFLTERPIVSGLLVYAFMNYVVLPLSAFPKSTRPPSAATLVNGILAVVFLVGLPIALAARHARGGYAKVSFILGNELDAHFSGPRRAYALKIR